MTDPASIAAAAERVRGEFGRLDVLVQNAAISNTSKRADQSVEDYAKTTRPSNVSLDEMHAVWDTNVFGRDGPTGTFTRWENEPIPW